MACGVWQLGVGEGGPEEGPEEPQGYEAHGGSACFVAGQARPGPRSPPANALGRRQGAPWLP